MAYASSAAFNNAIYGSIIDATAANDLIAMRGRMGASGSTYTQTYSTATATHADLTSATLTDSSGGSANTTVQAIGGSYSQTEVANNFADVVAQINALRVDLVNAKGVINKLIDDLQNSGYAS